MKITSSIEYATRLMVSLGKFHGGEAVSSKKLAEIENIPADFVDQILMHLRRAGLVKSQRGAGGGYILALSPSKIKLGDILRAMNGRIFDDVCEKYQSGEKECGRHGSCAISPVWRKLGVLIEDYLDSVTIEQLMGEKTSRAQIFPSPEAEAVV